MDTLLSGVTIVTMNEIMDVLFGAYLGVTDGKISYIGKKPPKEAPKAIIEGTGMVAIPGLVNCHTHLATTGLRNLLDDQSRAEALEQQLQRECKMDNRAAKACAKLGIAECLRFGVTSVSDLYYYPQAVAEAVQETGIKANIALSAFRFEDDNQEFDFETDVQCQELCRMADTWHGAENGRIKVDAGIFAEYTSNYQLWESLSDYACERGLGMQLHLAETQEEVDSCLDRTGLSPVELLNCHRLFRAPTAAVGCVAVSDDDLKFLGKNRVTAVSTPIAAGKAGNPVTPILKTVKAGLNVALGTGGAIECGNLDMFEVMRMASFMERSAGGDPTALPASAALMMATVCGARAQGRADSTGMLKEGMDADIALLDFTAPHLMPCHDVMGGVVFSAKGGDVAMTMVQGKILYQNGKFPTIDLKSVVEEITEYALPRIFADNKKE